MPNQHSDFTDCFAFIGLLRNARAANLRPFDIMLEAKAKDFAVLRLREQDVGLGHLEPHTKAKDFAVLRLREQVARFAPELAGCTG